MQHLSSQRGVVPWQPGVFLTQLGHRKTTQREIVTFLAVGTAFVHACTVNCISNVHNLVDFNILSLRLSKTCTCLYSVHVHIYYNCTYM